MNSKDLTFELLKYGNSNYLPTRVDTLERDLHQKIYKLQSQIQSLKPMPQHKRISALEYQINKIESDIQKLKIYNEQKAKTDATVKTMLNQRIISLENFIQENMLSSKQNF